jgi:Ca2+-binding RTX toxin-like protein
MRKGELDDMAVRYGTPGKDSIVGTISNDLLYGLGGSDVIYGGDRRDYISGGSGNDRVVGQLGNDILNGGSGYDRFVFGHLHDADIIQDFGPRDKIDLTQGIDHYFVTKVSSGVRIATVDWGYKADLVQGSIVLQGVTVEEWTSWGGAFGNPGGYSVSDYSSGMLIV